MLKSGEEFQAENNNSIVFKIDNFEGPLELLHFMIDKKKMKISEIKIFQLIDEYLFVIDKSQKDNLDIKVEFLIMATELLEIKAYSVLSLDKEKESEKELKRKLEEYKLFKEVTKEVSKLENEFNISYSRGDGRSIRKVESKEYNLKTLKADDIFDNYKKFLKEKEFIEIKYEKNFSTEEEADKILILIFDEKKKLEEIFERAESRLHLVYMFLAILDMYKEGKISLINLEGDIFLEKSVS